MVVVDLALAVLILADDFGLFGLLGVFVATGWRGESFSAAAAADAATEATPPRVRVDRRVAAVALLMVALLRIPKKNELSKIDSKIKDFRLRLPTSK